MEQKDAEGDQRKGLVLELTPMTTWDHFFSTHIIIRVSSSITVLSNIQPRFTSMWTGWKEGKSSCQMVQRSLRSEGALVHWRKGPHGYWRGVFKKEHMGATTKGRDPGAQPGRCNSYLCPCRWIWPSDRTSFWSPHSRPRRHRPRSPCLRRISSVPGCRSHPWHSGIPPRCIRSQMAALKQKSGGIEFLTALRV